MEDKTILGMFAMGCITAIEITALNLGIDGQLQMVVVAVISSLGGAGLSWEYLKRKAQPPVLPLKEAD